MTTTNANLPAIPFEDNFKYKHYYILRHASKSDLYYLHLLSYEPAQVIVDKSRTIVALDKYGNKIASRMYTYTDGDNGWGSGQNFSSLPTAYKNFDTRLLYNNFVLDFEDARFEKNSLPDDGVIPAVEPAYPAIPFEHSFKYKHYFILQNAGKLESYYLHLLAYEPAQLTVNNNGNITALEKYGKKIASRMYTYTIGQQSWSDGQSFSSLPTNYNNFSLRLIHNNFEMDFGADCYKKNPLADDNVVPATAPQFPPVPDKGNFENKQYYLLQHPTQLESYYLHLLACKPAFLEVVSNNLVAMQEDRSVINSAMYTYTIGDENWKDAGTFNTLPTPYNNFDLRLVNNNFEILLYKNGVLDFKAQVSRFKNDGTGPATTGWVETTIGACYYVDGYKFTSSTGWLELGSEPNVRIYFLDKERNWARAENTFKMIQGETYYFDENGVMLTGRGHKIGDMYYDFDSSGRLIREHWGEPVIPLDYYMGADEKKQIEYVFGVNPGSQSWSGFSASLANQVGKNLITVEVPAWKFDENNNKIAYTKRLTIHKKVSDVVISIFTEIFNSSEQFVIDNATTAGYANRGNTTSLHNYGIAIDINWEANPWLTNEGEKKTDGEYRPGIDPLSIEATSSVVQIFKKYGWYWGAEWNSSKDYMHFAYMNH